MVADNAGQQLNDSSDSGFGRAELRRLQRDLRRFNQADQIVRCGSRDRWFDLALGD